LLKSKKGRKAEIRISPSTTAPAARSGQYLAKLSDVGKPQRKFMIKLFGVILGLQGRATFENLSRYSHLTALTFRRWFAGHFDWLGFNLTCEGPSLGGCIGVVDCSFLPKSGSATCGLDKF